MENTIEFGRYWPVEYKPDPADEKLVWITFEDEHGDFAFEMRVAPDHAAMLPYNTPVKMTITQKED